MARKQTKRDKEDNMFIKRRCVCRRDHARKKTGYKDKGSITDGKREGGGRDERESEERRGEEEEMINNGGEGGGLCERHEASDDGAVV